MTMNQSVAMIFLVLVLHSILFAMITVNRHFSSIGLSDFRLPEILGVCALPWVYLIQWHSAKPILESECTSANTFSIWMIVVEVKGWTTYNTHSILFILSSFYFRWLFSGEIVTNNEYDEKCFQGIHSTYSLFFAEVSLSCEVEIFEMQTIKRHLDTCKGIFAWCFGISVHVLLFSIHSSCQ